MSAKPKAAAQATGRDSASYTVTHEYITWCDDLDQCRAIAKGDRIAFADMKKRRAVAGDTVSGLPDVVVREFLRRGFIEKSAKAAPAVPASPATPATPAPSMPAPAPVAEDEGDE